jgi:hypothetical protein
MVKPHDCSMHDIHDASEVGLSEYGVSYRESRCQDLGVAQSSGLFLNANGHIDGDPFIEVSGIS